MKIIYILIVSALFATGPCIAAWSLDNDASQVSFVSVKAGDAGEVHRFTEISGGLTAEGSASVTIQLASVDTLIPLRDERMCELLFQTNLFPTASLSTNIDMDALAALAPGESMDMTANLTLDLHGQQISLAAEMIVARLGDHRLMVSSRKPLIVNAASVDLVKGIEALREIANLPSISKAVPVSFVLSFVEE
ncbi:MAG: YceI family protein [Gammaproteobacteria bacterium]|nr:YceI family protein [Gammaproteobacteria bacterium]